MSDENLLLSFFEYLSNKQIDEALTLFKEVIIIFFDQDKKLSIDLGKILPSSLVNKAFISQFSLFLKYLVMSETEDSKTFEKLYKKFQIGELSNKEKYEEIMKELVAKYKKNKLNNTLNDYKWQLSIIDKETDTVRCSKFDKIEISFKFEVNENLDTNNESLIKMNYYEFSEIYDHLKKIENQLKAFK